MNYWQCLIVLTISIYNSPDLKKLRINFFTSKHFFNFHECEARVKIEKKCVRVKINP